MASVHIAADGRKVFSVPSCKFKESNAKVQSFSLKPSTFQAILGTMRTGGEMGGTFTVDTTQRVLNSAKVTRIGQANSVDIPHGVLEWHTHPSDCGMTECSLSSPSDTDVMVFLEDALTDNLGHMVFSLAGTFVVTFTPSLVQSLRDSGSRRERCEQIQRRFRDLQREFSRRFQHASTEEEKNRHESWHRESWLKLARESGFVVDFFPFGVAPRVRLLVADWVQQALAGVRPPLFVYNRFNRGALRSLIKKQKRDCKAGVGEPCFVLLDDCVYDRTVMRDPCIREIALNGRHMKIFFMFISQYTMDITPDIRCNVDYVFALRENIIMNRERLYRNFFGVVPTFEAFCEILDQCTQNYECLVVDHTSESNKIEDVIFWYKAPREHKFRIGSPPSGSTRAVLLGLAERAGYYPGREFAMPDLRAFVRSRGLKRMPGHCPRTISFLRRRQNAKRQCLKTNPTMGFLAHDKLMDYANRSGYAVGPLDSFKDVTAHIRNTLKRRKVPPKCPTDKKALLERRKLRQCLWHFKPLAPPRARK
eukprot:jgi/Mesvir1/57/Mv18872-RA.1